MNETKLVVDTNIFFSLLLCRDTAQRRRFLTDTGRAFYSPRFFPVELFKHKERIARATELSEDQLLECFSELLSRLHFVEEGGIPIGIWMEARRLCRDLDLKDTPFVALTLYLDGRSGPATRNSRRDCGRKASAAFSSHHRRAGGKRKKASETAVCKSNSQLMPNGPRMATPRSAANSDCRRTAHSAGRAGAPRRPDIAARPP